jgi:uncharacterized protein involved in tolerance to divalent cations
MSLMKVEMPFLTTQKESTYTLYVNLLVTHRCPELIHPSMYIWLGMMQEQNEITLMSLVKISSVE